MSDDRAALAQLLRRAQRVLFFTGAGISTGSGIADYRGPDGLWKTRQPVEFRDFMASAAARVEYWDQKLEVWPQIRDAQPNPTHNAIARFERSGRVVAVVTQNIDGLHRKAGTSPALLVELHGSNLEVECMSCHAMSNLRFCKDNEKRIQRSSYIQYCPRQDPYLQRGYCIYGE